MIFVTVGAQIPFDRLVRAVDLWAGERGRDDVFAQIGESDFQPANMESARFLEPARFTESVNAADLIVGHAGTGSIFAALGACKPIVVMPRLASLRETRNEHQTATMERFADYKGVYAAPDEEALHRHLDQSDGYEGGTGLPEHASEELVSALTGFLRSIRR